MKAVKRDSDNFPQARGGFTVIEVLVAVTVLLISAIAFVPLFVFIAEGSQANRARLTAANLATTAVEQIRSMPYNEVGTVGGNPPGAIQRTRTVTVNGMSFTITTDIWWVDDPGDDPAMGSDPIPYDYKRVRVTVSAPGLFNGSAAVTADLDTLVSLEGEEEAFPGGNLRAVAIRGWRTSPGDKVPVEGVQVELTSGPDAPQSLWTDDQGRALFAVLDAGTYTVEVDPSGIGMMVCPGQSPASKGVAEGANTEAEFEVEVPCRLALELKDAFTGLPVSASGTAMLDSPFNGGDRTVNFTAGADGVVPKELFGKIWPVGDGYAGVYGLLVTARGYKTYKLEEAPDPKWSGRFSGPGETRAIPVALTPTAAVGVTDSGGNPLPGVLVEAFCRTYTYSGSAWAFADGPPVSGTTDQQGVCRLPLPDNDPPPPIPSPPQAGNTYSLYCVRATAIGRGTVEKPDAFWVHGEDQYVSPGVKIQSYIIIFTQ